RGNIKGPSQLSRKGHSQQSREHDIQTEGIRESGVVPDSRHRIPGYRSHQYRQLRSLAPATGGMATG
ncbi:Hypothetical predicted protein, partial [Marmota monax]